MLDKEKIRQFLLTGNSPFAILHINSKPFSELTEDDIASVTAEDIRAAYETTKKDTLDPIVLQKWISQLGEGRALEMQKAVLDLVEISHQILIDPQHYSSWHCYIGNFSLWNSYVIDQLKVDKTTPAIEIAIKQFIEECNGVTPYEIIGLPIFAQYSEDVIVQVCSKYKLIDTFKPGISDGQGGKRHEILNRAMRCLLDHQDILKKIVGPNPHSSIQFYEKITKFILDNGSPYAILGINKPIADVTSRDIDDRAKQLQLQYHPDKCQDGAAASPAYDKICIAKEYLKKYRAIVDTNPTVLIEQQRWIREKTQQESLRAEAAEFNRIEAELNKPKLRQIIVEFLTAYYAKQEMEIGKERAAKDAEVQQFQAVLQQVTVELQQTQTESCKLRKTVAQQQAEIIRLQGELASIQERTILLSDQQGKLANEVLADSIYGSHLCEAISKSDILQIKLLILAGARLNTQSPGNNYTPLHWTFILANSSYARQLISGLLFEAGADPLLPDSTGKIPLDYAPGDYALTTYTKAAAAKLLFSRYHIPNVNALLLGNYTTYLNQATANGEFLLVKLLVLAGAEINAASTGCKYTPLHWAVCNLGFLPIKEQEKYNPIIITLCEAGADPLQVDAYGKIPLDYYPQHACLAAYTEKKKYQRATQKLVTRLCQ